MTKLEKPVIITIEDQGMLNLLAALTGCVGIKTILEYGADPAEAFAVFSELESLASRDNPTLMLIKK